MEDHCISAERMRGNHKTCKSECLEGFVFYPRNFKKVKMHGFRKNYLECSAFLDTLRGINKRDRKHEDMQRKKNDGARDFGE